VVLVVTDHVQLEHVIVTIIQLDAITIYFEGWRLGRSCAPRKAIPRSRVAREDVLMRVVEVKAVTLVPERWVPPGSIPDEEVTIGVLDIEALIGVQNGAIVPEEASVGVFDVEAVCGVGHPAILYSNALPANDFL
jgi:hypothetical protein